VTASSPLKDYVKIEKNKCKQIQDGLPKLTKIDRFAAFMARPHSWCNAQLTVATFKVGGKSKLCRIFD
jgi:hypothetical protein